jgi:hypothetical protein
MRSGHEAIRVLWRAQLPRLAVLALVLPWAVPLVACSQTLQQLTADPDDFASYREYRSAEQLPERFRSASNYLRSFQEGRWRREVHQWFEQTSGAYLKRWWNDERRLIAYQNWTDQGPYSAMVEQRLHVLAAQNVAQRDLERRMLREARASENEFNRATRLRQQLLQEFRSWLGQLAALRSFGRTTAQLPHEFLHRFREVEPRARCEAQHCSKLVLLPYGVAAEGKLSWRELLFQVDLALDQGLVVGAGFEGVGLLDSVAEALQKRAVARNNLQAKAEALGATMQLISIAIEASLPADRCEKPAVSPMVLLRECDGVRLEVHVAQSDDAPDRIVLRPVNAVGPLTPAAPASSAR